MSVRTVTEWYQIIQDSKDDGKLAKELLDSLTSYQGLYHSDINQTLNLITAIRLDQMAKEGS